MTNHNASLNTVVNQLADQEKRWFAIYTKYKCEKYVADSLSKKDIIAYVPLMNKTKRYTRKIKHFEIPLINCYVFVQICKKEYVPTLETEYVMKFLKQGKDLLCIPESEMILLKRVAGDIVEVVPFEPSGLSLGEEVEIISGQLAGLKGKIVSKSGKRQFCIDLVTLGMQLRMEVDAKLIQPVNKNTLTA